MSGEGVEDFGGEPPSDEGVDDFLDIADLLQGGDATPSARLVICEY